MSESDVNKGGLIEYFRRNKKLTKMLALILAILVSVFALTPLGEWFLDKTCAKTVNKKLSDARAVSVGALAASVAIAAMPEDSTTPLAEQIVDMTDYMLLGMVGLTIEQIIMKIAPILLFWIGVPFLLIYLLELRGSLEKGRIAIRVFAFCLCLFFVDPLSVFLTNQIDGIVNLQEKIDYIVDDGNEVESEEINSETVEITEETYTETVDEEEEDGGFFSDIANAAKSAYNAVADTAVDAYNAVADVVDSAVNIVGDAIDYAKALLSRLMEVVTVFIISTCLLPIAMLILLKHLTMYIFDGIVKEKLEKVSLNPTEIGFTRKLTSSIHKKAQENSD